jgi:DNA-binding MarR family transcriptional regulator
MLPKQEIAEEEHVGLLIGAVRRRITQALGSSVRRYHLTPRQFWIVVALYEHPGLSLRELAAHLRMDDPTASRVIFALMNRKLVQVKNDAADRRRSRLYLGPLGATLGKELHELATAVREATTEGLSVAERQALRTCLRKIIANMDRFQERHLHNRPAARKDSQTKGSL